MLMGAMPSRYSSGGSYRRAPLCTHAISSSNRASRYLTARVLAGTRARHPARVTAGRGPVDKVRRRACWPAMRR